MSEVKKMLTARLYLAKMEFEIINQAIKNLDKEGEMSEKSDEAEETPAPVKTKATTKKAAAPVKVEESDESEESEDDLDLDGEDETPAITLEAVRKTVKTFALKHGKDKAVKLLQKFKATSMSDIKTNDYAKVIELAEKHM